MYKVALLLGTNIGEREENLKKAAELIAEKAGSIIQESKIYATAPWGKQDQPQYLNQALLLQTWLEPEALLYILLEIEQEMGRVREEKWSARIIDIDILLMEDKVIASETLTVPHPHLQHRNFTLYPLNEIAPDWEHPTLKKTVNELLKESADSDEVIIHT